MTSQRNESFSVEVDVRPSSVLNNSPRGVYSKTIYKVHLKVIIDDTIFSSSSSYIIGSLETHEGTVQRNKFCPADLSQYSNMACAIIGRGYEAIVRWLMDNPDIETDLNKLMGLRSRTLREAPTEGMNNE